MIYREKELASLKQAYQNMQQTRSMQLRFICGEAGSGKSVLANMFMDETEANAEQTLFVSSYCCIRSEYNIPYQPFKELLKQLLQDVKESGGEEKTRKEKIKDSLAFCGKMLLEHAPDLIGNFIPGSAILPVIGQHLFKEKEASKPLGFVEESKILEQYADAIRAIAAKYKLVLFIDDLQWIDNASVNLFYRLVVGLQNSPVLIVGCYRSADIDMNLNGEKHPMIRLITEVKILRGNVFINLDSQSEDERKALMNRMLDTEPNIYDNLFRKSLFKRTNGNPLFVNELVNLLKEEGMVIRNNDGIWMNNADLQWKSYPVRIEGIIQERIGRLEDSLVEILSHASVQGYNFIAQVLSKTMGESERDTLMTLSKTLQKQHHLVNEDNCTRSNQGMVSRFNFSNYIFQQYLYHELSMTQRMMLHSDIAVIMEDFFKDNTEEVAPDIARHYEMSGEYDKALKYIRITVENMMKICAYEEAGMLIKKGLGFIESFPASPEWEKEKLSFMVLLCICYRSLKGWGDAEVEELFEQTKDLGKKLRIFDHIEVVLFGLWSIKLSKLQLEECRQLALRNMNTALRHSNISVKLMALLSLGNTYFWLGQLKDAEESFAYFFETLKQVPEDDLSRNETMQLNHQAALMFTLLIAQQKKENAVAAEMKNKIEELLNRNGNTYYKAAGYQALAWYHYFAGESEKSRTFAEEMIRLSEKYHFNSYLHIGELFKGGSLIGEDNASAEDLIRKGYQGLLELNRTEVSVMHSVYAHMLGNVYLQSQRKDLARTFLEQEIALSETKNEKIYTDLLNDLFTQSINK